MLMLVSAVIYGCIVMAMPNTYQATISNNLESKLPRLIEKLETEKLEDSGEILNQFMLENYTDLILSDEEGNIITPPGLVQTNKVSVKEKDKNLSIAYAKINVADEVADDKDEKVKNIVSLVTASEIGRALMGDHKANAVEVQGHISEEIHFKDESKAYRLAVKNYSIVVEQASQILWEILPVVIGIVCLISVVISFLYARFITSPIKKVSQTADRMSTLDLRCEKASMRKDEIGILSRALNQLAAKLSSTLEDLQITNRHLEEANYQLEQDIEKERKLEQKRREFFSAVSHELKTPITIIKGQLEGMIYKVGSYKDRDTYLKKSLQVMNQMEEMVLEILSISRIESFDFKLVKEKVDLKALVEKSMASAKELADHKDMIIVANLEDGQVIGDTKMIKKVVDNILSNGISHSPQHAEIRIGLERREQSMLLTIENTKVHIDEAEISKLFEAFYRVEKSRNRHMGGTGLGLYIVKTILDMHHLTYGIENTDSGVRFWINFTENTN